MNLSCAEGEREGLVAAPPPMREVQERVAGVGTSLMPLAALLLIGFRQKIYKNLHLFKILFFFNLCDIIIIQTKGKKTRKLGQKLKKYMITFNNQEVYGIQILAIVRTDLC